ncbi:MAG: hypothetical protein ACXVW7_17590 [Trebonia sp.]
MTRSADRRLADPVMPAVLAPGRYHGSLDTITDSERRALRPIGTSAHEVAVRTGALLTDLLALPGVRIFQGVRPAAAEDMPRIPHAISTGRQLLLVESVAWPPGRYAAGAAGRIHCDGTYIGQSVRPLINAVRHWRESLPRGHRVSALVVVHPTTEGDLALPSSTTRDLAWTRADDAVRDIRARLPRGRQAVSTRAVATLFAATAGAENR